MAPASESNPHGHSFGCTTVLASLNHHYSALLLTAIILALWTANRHRRQAAILDNSVTKQPLEPRPLLDLPPPLRSTLSHARCTDIDSGSVTNTSETLMSPMPPTQELPPPRTSGPWRRHSCPLACLDSESATGILSDDTQYYHCTENDNDEQDSADLKPKIWRRRTIVFETPHAPSVDSAIEDEDRTAQRDPCNDALSYVL